jgi:hypothetical protein
MIEPCAGFTAATELFGVLTTQHPIGLEANEYGHLQAIGDSKCGAGQGLMTALFRT